MYEKQANKTWSIVSEYLTDNNDTIKIIFIF